LGTASKAAQRWWHRWVGPTDREKVSWPTSRNGGRSLGALHCPLARAEAGSPHRVRAGSDLCGRPRAKGADHLLREPCRELLRATERGSLTATPTAEAIQEFAHVRARRRDRRDASSLAALYADLLSPLLEVGESDLREGLRLFERHPALGAFDAVLAATGLQRGVDGLVSADTAFAAVKGLRFVELAGLDVETLG